MTDIRGSEGLVRDWLRHELDAVPEPHRAVQVAIQAAASLSQRRPRGTFRDRLARWKQPVAHGVPLPPPSVVLWASESSHGRAARPTSRAAQAAGLSLVSVLIVIGLAGAVVATFLVLASGSSSPLPGGVTAAASPTPRPALILEPPADGGRRIIVDALGQGHFWTISEAVEAAVDGDVIVVKPGTYQESVIITSDVEIIGQGGPDDVILMPGPSGAGGPGNWDDARSRAISARDGFAILDPSAYEAEISPAVLEKGWRFILYLRDSGANVSRLTLRGSEVGTAILIEGGDPVLSGLVIDPDGQQRNKTATDPHEAVAVGRASTATIRDSTISAFMTLGEGSRATVTGNDFLGSCLMVGGEGTEARVTGNHFEGSECPRYHIWVMDGASPVIESNTIVGDRQTDGIKASGPGTNATIQGNTLDGGDTGIWIGGGATGLVSRNNVTGARTGIAIVGSAPVIHSNEFHDNEIGVMADEGATPDLIDNLLCGNGVDVEQDGDSVVPAAGYSGCAGNSGS